MSNLLTKEQLEEIRNDQYGYHRSTIDGLLNHIDEQAALIERYEKALEKIRTTNDPFDAIAIAGRALISPTHTTSQDGRGKE